MDNLLENIESIKEKITSNEYITIMENLTKVHENLFPIALISTG